MLEEVVHGARDFEEPGIFVAFEESPKRIGGNLQGFVWKVADLQRVVAIEIDAHSGRF